VFDAELPRQQPNLELNPTRPDIRFMNRSFVPSFQHFQKDVEGYLKSEGKCEKNAIGQTVYRGYQAAVTLMFRTYMEKKAFVPLVAEFRTWNWEWSYDDYHFRAVPPSVDTSPMLERM
jgi:hypothetical protein